MKFLFVLSMKGRIEWNAIKRGIEKNLAYFFYKNVNIEENNPSLSIVFNGFKCSTPRGYATLYQLASSLQSRENK